MHKIGIFILLLMVAVASCKIYGEEDLTRITTSPAPDLSPSWSPDGKKIVYTSEGSIFIFDLELSGEKKPKEIEGVLWVYDLENPTYREIKTYLKKPYEEPEFSPDGKRIAFISSHAGSKDIWVMNTDGTGIERLTTLPGAETSPSWSPDGKKIAYEYGRKIHILDLETGESREIKSYIKDYRQPAISPDGKRIAFISSQLGHDDLWIINLDGTNPFSLTDDPVQEENPSWHPYGEKLVFEAGKRAWVIDLKRNVTGISSIPDLRTYREPRFSPDGKRLVFVSDYKVSDDIWMIQLERVEVPSPTPVMETPTPTPVLPSPSPTPTPAPEEPGFEIFLLLMVFIIFSIYRYKSAR